jgi:hypothetical protein
MNLLGKGGAEKRISIDFERDDPFDDPKRSQTIQHQTKDQGKRENARKSKMRKESAKNPRNTRISFKRLNQQEDRTESRIKDHQHRIANYQSGRELDFGKVF